MLFYEKNQTVTGGFPSQRSNDIFFVDGINEVFRNSQVDGNLRLSSVDVMTRTNFPKQAINPKFWRENTI